MEKLENFYTVSENVKCTSTMETVQRFLKKLKIELPYNPAIPFLGIYSYALPHIHFWAFI